MKTKIFTLIAALLFSVNLYSQSITNKLGTNGLYFINDGSSTFLTLKQSNGFLGLGTNPTQQFELSRNFKLPMTPDSNSGVIYKGNTRFIHNYSPLNTLGRNTFIGLYSGNFTMQYVDEFKSTYNVGIGDSTLTSLTTGSNNVALGSLTLAKNSTGSVNTAVGHSAMMNNLTGLYNVSLGSASMLANVSGSDNVSVGVFSLFSNVNGNSNNALGFDALYSNTGGNNNVAIGKNSLFLNTTGSNNTAIGNFTGTVLQTGSNNTFIGNNAQATSLSVSNQITLGNNQVNSLRCNVQSITSLSDMRDKKNIDDLSLGLDFISKLKPRQFSWDRRDWYENNISDGSKTEKKLNAGFIAQELDAVQSDENAVWLGLVNKDNPDKIEATYGNLLPVMVKAIQELNEKNEILKSENQNLRSELSLLKDLKEKLSSLEILQACIKKEIEIMKESKTVNEVKVVDNK